jgi:hypothetical protein
MYEVIFDEMLDAGVAISLQIPIFTDIDGNPVDETKHFGQKQSIKITKPGGGGCLLMKVVSLLHKRRMGM